MRLRTTGWAIGATALAIGVTACTPGNAATPTATPTATASASGESTPSSGTQSPVLEETYEKVVQDVLTSVVQIEAGDSLGSGIVYDDKGHIVTNAHVVGTVKRMTVSVATNSEGIEANLVASFPAGDLAVLEVADPKDLPDPAKFADSDEVDVGQIVLAMGNPLGLSGSVTQGIVSALGRTITSEAEDGLPSETLTNMIQTSAPINPGNSGGALVNLDSEVVGVPTLAATGENNSAADGIGFAIPSNAVTRIAGDIIKNGKVTNSGRAELGIRGTTVTDDQGEPDGVGVLGVEKDSPAADAGIQRGDVIVELNGEQVYTLSELQEILAQLSPGQTVEVGMLRDGKETTVKVKLGEI